MMANREPPIVSRRQWVRAISATGAAAALGAAPAASIVQTSQRASGADSASLGTRVYNIRDYGAKGDGKSLDTAAVQAAIDACAKDQGGTVLVPAGTFVIGTIELKSNVTLHVAAAGKLLGSQDGSHYHAATGIPTSGDSTLNDGNWALIYAIGATNVTVEGPGTIEGAWPLPDGIHGSSRPYGLLFYRCKNIAVRDIRLLRCPYHMVRAIQSAYIVIDGVYIHNRVGGNDDGFHFVSCEYVNMSNSNVQCQDDACALFGGCRFVTVTNCTFSTRWSVFRFGGGTAENIVVSNCVLAGVLGCPIKFQGGPGSTFQNMSFSNLIFQDVTGPIHISISSPAGMTAPAEPQEPPPAQPAQPVRREGPAIVRNISFSNIHGNVLTVARPKTDYFLGRGHGDGEAFSAIVLNCVGSAVMENISLSDVHLTFGGGGNREFGANRNVPQRAGEYFSLGPIPAYGVYARGVKGLTLDNVRLQVASKELRPAIVFERVTDAALSGVSAEGNIEAESVLRFVDSKDVLLTASRVPTPAGVFLRVEGPDNADIVIDGGDLSKAAKPLSFAAGAGEKAVRVRTEGLCKRTSCRIGWHVPELAKGVATRKNTPPGAPGLRGVPPERLRK